MLIFVDNKFNCQLVAVKDLKVRYKIEVISKVEQKEIKLQIKIANRLEKINNLIKIIQTPDMTSVQKNKSHRPQPAVTAASLQVPIVHRNKLAFANQHESDSDQEHSKLIVEALFGNSQKPNPKHLKPQLIQEEDQDIKRFLQEQIPGLYEQKQDEEKICQEEQQNFYSYYNSSIAPEYFTMSRFQKQNYFDNLNIAYMARLTSSKNSNSDASESTKKRKPAIKFNQIVFQLPFNKQEEPIIVRQTQEEEAYLAFDDAAYESDQDSDSQRQYERQKEQFLSQTDNYFDDFDSAELQEEYNNKLLSNICKQKMKLYMPEEGLSQDGDLDDFIFNQSESYSSSQNQNIIKNSNSTIVQSDEQDFSNKFKRGADRKFIAESSSQSSEQNSESSGILEQSDNSQQSGHSQSSGSLNQFIDCVQGRKIPHIDIKNNHQPPTASNACLIDTLQNQTIPSESNQNQTIPSESNQNQTIPSESK